jgi:phage gp36-like protein
MVEVAPPLYTDRAETEKVYSTLGINLRLDDDEDDTVDATEETYLDEMIENATDVINQYALHFYTATELAESRWVRSRATWIACYLLSRRRGNSAQFVDEYNAIIAELELVRRGQFFIPRLKTYDDFLPCHSNLKIDRRYSREKIRVDSITSTGGSYSGQQQEHIWPHDYF